MIKEKLFLNKEILKSNNVGEIVNSFLEDLIKKFSNDKEVYTRENQLEAFKTKIKPTMGRSIKDDELESIVKLKNEEFENIIKKSLINLEDANLELEKRIFLQTVDFLWRSHLQYLEHLRQVVGLRGYAQKDPLEEFKREAFKLFEGLLNKIKIDFITFLNNLEIVPQKEKEIKSLNTKSKGLENNPKCLLIIRKNEKISRNEKCPATGKKYKHCCGAL